MNTITSEQMISGEEALALLRKGTAQFNSWRRQNETVVLNLAGQDLSELDLSSYDLSGAVPGIRSTWKRTLLLRDCILRKLDGARLWGADLTRVNLEGALCRGTAGDIQQSFLLADLSEANLKRADFSWNGFVAADLTKSDLAHTIFCGTNMERVRGLEQARSVGYAHWYGASGLSANARGYILRLVVLAMESSWVHCGTRDMAHLAAGEV